MLNDTRFSPGGPGARLLVQGCQPVGEYRPRRDDVHAKAARSVLERRGLREPDDAVLGRDVPGDPAHAVEAGGGRHVHDRPTARREQRRDLVLHGEERPAQIYADREVEVVR
ncbi:MAG: hypothetical protein AUH42_00450 [Gemmatimonadetes bacterium 13_1_40CM_70_11]|nr:MAG: hypothetical protein AUH42_00450 [Gemmatimonadetes bacterium 13_1_40CM_70_11]